MDSKMYTVSEALKLLQEAQKNAKPSITIHGIQPLCADRARELCSLPNDALHCFINSKSNLPGATYTLSA